MTTRQRARAWLESNTPNLTGSPYRSSKYFEDGDIWFFTIPLDILEGDETLNLMLEKKEASDGFELLEIPSAFLKQNLSKIRVRKNKDKFDLHISAKEPSWLVDIRGDGLDLSSFLRRAAQSL